MVAVSGSTTPASMVRVGAQDINHALGDQVDTVHLGNRKQTQELLAAISNQDIAVSQAPRQGLGHVPQSEVTHAVSEAVIDRLEQVHINHDQPQRMAQSTRVLAAHGIGMLQAVAQGQPRELIPMDRNGCKVFAQLIEQVHHLALIVFEGLEVPRQGRRPGKCVAAHGRHGLVHGQVGSVYPRDQWRIVFAQCRPERVQPDTKSA